MLLILARLPQTGSAHPTMWQKPAHNGSANSTAQLLNSLKRKKENLFFYCWAVEQ